MSQPVTATPLAEPAHSPQRLLFVVPRLPSCNFAATVDFYVRGLGFVVIAEYANQYLILQRDEAEVHFFTQADLDPLTNPTMYYLRVSGIDQWAAQALAAGLLFAPAGQLHITPWGQREFALLDPNGNLLTFGEAL
jgi:catechol 2,3-dioxygenase-like lactoylglutathione lyase family enzyme